MHQSTHGDTSRHVTASFDGKDSIYTTPYSLHTHIEIRTRVQPFSAGISRASTGPGQVYCLDLARQRCNALGEASNAENSTIGSWGSHALRQRSPCQPDIAYEVSQASSAPPRKTTPFTFFLRANPTKGRQTYDIVSSTISSGEWIECGARM
ncbi:hypothetical protein BDV96DRAFT_380423 [Lophiotrema nucula]|uniref:Uncharacterized protein n=1 Tax=Lophiotrema nucula TaxID=690887 RepID=A0A6A5ZH46_9PLEO|nr:hypothetical protein BDV96DRAFT_380423 [Lophiotrema nucula]